MAGLHAPSLTGRAERIFVVAQPARRAFFRQKLLAGDRTDWRVGEPNIAAAPIDLSAKRVENAQRAVGLRRVTVQFDADPAVLKGGLDGRYRNDARNGDPWQ